MFQSTYCLLKLFQSVQSVYGRKKLQKMVHLLENAGFDFPFKYEYHFYGPYSAQLQEEIQVMVQQGFLEETKKEAYIYNLTEKGEEFTKRLEEDGDYQFSLSQQLLETLSEEDSQFLEMVSTYAFLMESGYDAEQAKNKAGELKPHLIDLLEDAIAFYDKDIFKNKC